MQRHKFQIQLLVLLVILSFLVVACSSCQGPQTVKPYELGKVTAETILYDARVLQNNGAITADQFNEVRKVYDQLRIAQDSAIDARKALIAFNTTGNQVKAQEAFNAVLSISTKLISLAQSLGLMKGL